MRSLMVMGILGMCLGCGGGGGATDSGADAGVDATTDAATDSAIDAAPDVDAGPACSPATGDEPAAGRWALSLFHFNIQYVAGGLRGFMPGRLESHFDFDEAQTEDLIIRESFLPLLDILEAHPTFQLSIEMQGRMIEILGERFPADLARTKALVDSRQLELIALHYSDELVVAYPKHHLERSLAMTRAAAADAGLTLSTSVFTQEGFFGEGVLDVMRENGLGTALVGHNLVEYQRASLGSPAAFDREGTPVLMPSRGALSTSGADLRWTYFDDGELLAVGAAPYVGDFFVRNQSLIDAYVARLSCLEAEGFHIGRIDDYVAALDTASVTRAPLGEILDGDWQPDDTDNVLRWMGALGNFHVDHDDDVLAGNHRAGFLVDAAETLFANAGASALSEGRARLDAAWRELMFAEVSDSTGWNPWQGEVDYSLNHAAEARRMAGEVIHDQLLALGWAAADVDPAAGTASETSDPSPVMLSPVTTPPVAVTVDAPDRMVTTTWAQRPDGVYVLDITLSAPTPVPARRDGAPMTITFPSTSGRIRYTPAMTERVTDLPFSDFAFDHIYLPAQNGLFGVDGGFMIMDEAVMHLAVGFFAAGGVKIYDESLADDAPTHLRLLFTDGDATTALALADATNVQRPLVVCAADASCGLPTR